MLNMQAATKALAAAIESAPRVEGTDGLAIDLRRTVENVLRAADSGSLVVPKYDHALALDARYRTLGILDLGDPADPGLTLSPTTTGSGLVRTTMHYGPTEFLAGYALPDVAHLTGLAYCSAATQAAREA